MKYQAKPKTVEAFQWNGGKLDALPEWATLHRAQTAVSGLAGIAKDAVGQLLVPTKSETKTCRLGDYVVLDGERVDVIRKAEFEADFELVAESDPAPAPADTEAKPARGKAAPKADEPPAE